VKICLDLVIFVTRRRIKRDLRSESNIIVGKKDNAKKEKKD